MFDEERLPLVDEDEGVPDGYKHIEQVQDRYVPEFQKPVRRPTSPP